MHQKSLQKGFTLIELLVVIAILAILAVAVVLTLNPAQLFKQARDSQRISDMATLRSAISLYLADVNPSLISMGSASNCYDSAASAAVTSGCGGRYLVATTVVTSTAAAAASTTGGGWIPINFALISSGSPLGTEPIDPVNNATYYYGFAANATYQFKLTAHMESTRYASGGGSDVESTDGGSSSSVYEVGTNLGL